MKKILLLIFLLAQYGHTNGQCLGNWLGGYYTFEDISINYECLFWRDTIADSDNVWQIGVPHKAVFDTAYSPNNVIVTDVLHPYPRNDTSSFTFAKLPGTASGDWHWNGFDGYYYVNSDTIADYGRIEFSPDNGVTWIDMLKDTGVYVSWSPMQKPILSGNSNGWKPFRCTIRFDMPGHILPMGDTFLYRFTFISDSIDTHKDGLMFDNIGIFDEAEGVTDRNKPNTLISVFPNPTTDKLHFKHAGHPGDMSVKIISCTGAVVRTVERLTESEIDIHDLPEGMYLLQCTTAEMCEVKRFVIRR